MEIDLLLSLKIGATMCILISWDVVNISPLLVSSAVRL